MPPNTSICPSAKVLTAPPLGNYRAGPGGGPSSGKRTEVLVGWGLHLLTSLRVLGVADLGSPQPQVSVSALSSERLSLVGAGAP